MQKNSLRVVLEIGEGTEKKGKWIHELQKKKKKLTPQ